MRYNYNGKQSQCDPTKAIDHKLNAVTTREPKQSSDEDLLL
jgi:hypothetical protein